MNSSVSTGYGPRPCDHCGNVATRLVRDPISLEVVGWACVRCYNMINTNPDAKDAVARQTSYLKAEKANAIAEAEAIIRKAWIDNRGRDFSQE